MGEPAAKLMTVEEFLAWDDGTDRRYELIGGQIVMMNPPLRPHRVLAIRIGAALSNRLRPPCLAESEAGIRLPWTSRNFYKADIAVSCAPFSREQWCPDPVLIVEVLSPSTEKDDRSVKLAAYRRLPTVRDILLVASDRVSVEHYARAGAFWRIYDLGPGDVIQLEALGIEIPVDELYAGLPLEPATADTDAPGSELAEPETLG